MTRATWRRVGCAGLVLAMAVGVATSATAQGGPEADWDLVFDTDSVVRLGEYELPPGEYWIEQVAMDGTVFALYNDDDPARAEPIAMLDTWRVPVPRIEVAEAEVRIHYDPDDQRLPIVEGWMIDGQRWKLRDVIAADDQDVLTLVFSD